MVDRYCSTDTPTNSKESCFILSQRSNFHMFDNVSVAVHAFAKRLLSLFSVKEILLPRCVNGSTNFRGSPVKVKVVSPCLKHMNAICICVHEEVNASSCLLQAIQHGFGLSTCICAQPYNLPSLSTTNVKGFNKKNDFQYTHTHTYIHTIKIKTTLSKTSIPCKAVVEVLYSKSCYFQDLFKTAGSILV